MRGLAPTLMMNDPLGVPPPKGDSFHVYPLA